MDRDLLLEYINNARENGNSFTGWTYEQVAADIIDHTDLDHPVQDVANELVALATAGEIYFV